jgi:hypothetical protein
LKNQAKEIVKGEEMITLFTVNTFQKLGTFPKKLATFDQSKKTIRQR